ncbi:MAG: hypothetical protein ABI574_18925 [Burkholderiales bacterium]
MKLPPRRALLNALFSALVLPATLAMLAAPTPATAQASVSIGIHIGSYPNLVRVPSYPVYYAPGLPVNLFFYDGLYWLFANDRWYTSPWYDGPWDGVGPFAVPLYVLRIPVRYYRVPPPYFRPWRADAPPRWGEHWGPDWTQRHAGWDRWNHRAVPAPAPLPTYQRQYSGPRYPSADEQRSLQQRHYRYQPREAVARERIQPGAAQPPSPRAEPPSADRPAIQRPDNHARPPAPPRNVQQRPAPPQPRDQRSPPRPPAEPDRPRPQATERAHPSPPQPQERPRTEPRPLEPRPAAPERGADPSRHGGPPGGPDRGAGPGRDPSGSRRGDDRERGH